MTILALALPAALLLTLIFLYSRQRRKTRSAIADRKAVTPASGPAPNRLLDPQPIRDSEPAGKATDLSSLKSQITQAENDKSLNRLAPLHLALARQLFEAGRDGEALTALRSAAGLASLHGPAEVHADARLELAEAAYRGGDLTSACEQWQMARSALQNELRDGRVEVIEKRMRENGCPTDWVLTDF